MRSFLFALIPWVAAYWALSFTVVAFGGDWPNWWILPGAVCAGFAFGSRRFLP